MRGIASGRHRDSSHAPSSGVTGRKGQAGVSRLVLQSILAISAIFIMYSAFSFVTEMHVRQGTSVSKPSAQQAAASTSTSARPLVALVFSGALRTLTACNGTVVKHIIQANPHLDFESFAFTTVEKEQDVAAGIESMRQSVAGLKLAVVQSDAGVQRVVEGLLGVRKEMLHAGRGTAAGKALNVIKMFYGIASAERLRQDYVRRASSTTGSIRSSGAAERHALVVRLRPDLCFCRPLSLDPALDVSKAQIHIPTGRGGARVALPWFSEGLAFDQFAAGSATVMAQYAFAFNSTVMELARSGGEFYPEAVLGYHLAASGLDPVPLPSFHASLARGRSPDVTFADPFGKLRDDFHPMPQTPQTPDINTNTAHAEGQTSERQQRLVFPDYQGVSPMPEDECSGALRAMS